MCVRCNCTAWRAHVTGCIECVCTDHTHHCARKPQSTTPVSPQPIGLSVASAKYWSVPASTDGPTTGTGWSRRCTQSTPGPNDARVCAAYQATNATRTAGGSTYSPDCAFAPRTSSYGGHDHPTSEPIMSKASPCKPNKSTRTRTTPLAQHGRLWQPTGLVCSTAG